MKKTAGIILLILYFLIFLIYKYKKNIIYTIIIELTFCGCLIWMLYGYNFSYFGAKGLINI